MKIVSENRFSGKTYFYTIAYSQSFCPAVCQSCKNISPKEEGTSYEEEMRESGDESQAKEVCLQEAMLKYDLDSELKNGCIDDEDFSADMKMDDHDVDNDAETGASGFFKSESEGLTKTSIKKPIVKPKKPKSNKKTVRSEDCETCGKTFHYKRGYSLHSRLNEHKRKVHMKEEQRVQCEICKVWKSNKKVLENHKRAVHTGEKPYICTFCPLSFYSFTGMCSHRTATHRDSWAAEKGRRDWLKMNKGRDPTEYHLQCHLCEEKRQSTEELRGHWAEAHPGMTDLRGPTEKRVRGSSHDNRGPCTCEYCGETYQSQQSLRIHISWRHREHLNVVAKCDICGKGYCSKDGLYMHKTLVHKVSVSNLKGEPRSTNWVKNAKAKSIVCDVCGLAMRPHNYKKHMKTHANAANKPTKCMYCDKEFRAFQNMTSHRKFAHAEEYKRDRNVLMEKEGSQYLTKEHPSSKKYAAMMKEKKLLLVQIQKENQEQPTG